MRIPLRTAVAAPIALLLIAPAAGAATITIKRNGYNGPNGQVTGPGIVGSVPFSGSSSADIVLNNVQANSNYSVDFFHTSGTGSSDFSFGTNATAQVGNQGTNVGGSFAMGTAAS